MKSNKTTYKTRTLLAAALLTGAGMFSITADAIGDATLNRLEVKVDGRNILTNFNPATKTYEIELGEDASSLATFSAAPASKDAIVDININGTTYSNHSLGSLQGGENIITYTVKNGTQTETYTLKVKAPQVTRSEYFTWKNANIYFVLTDRFYNGDTSNDESYHRHKTAGGSNVATFHGGDIKGLTQKLDYLDKLGVNAIWISAPYEQMHGWTGGKGNAFPHYAFHGYYTLDWTFMDRNMGTIEDMRNFVTEAHKRGIRVVMDIVLNHTGYSTLDDCIDYDFGNINGNPQAGWVPNDGNYTMWGRSDVSFNASQQGKWGNWWGPFVRAFGDQPWASSAGYAPEGGDDKTKPLSGLPDVVTERTQPVNIPPFLKKKWAAEKGGEWDKYRLPTAEAWRVDGKGGPGDYVINWLAAWVEYFGIDGFRCDTAKHVEFASWNKLKNACKAALQKWRQSERADQYAKGWTTDFWMTGEAWGWDHGDTGYFSQGGFDSMINFAFNGTEGGTGRTPTVGDWEYYSNFCNGNNGKQVLNYVSSHDTGLHRPGDQKNVGTMLLLCPGGSQIYYGDETSRPTVDGKGDPGMVTRGDFNWNAEDNEVNKHWQKVGQFRRRNAAVGAGTQTNLGADTYGRKFSENGYTNGVVIRLNTQSGQSYTVNVSGIFNDGQRVMDGYDTSKTATVSGGKVTMTASGPVMLIEEYGTVGGYIPPVPTPTAPVVTASPSGGTFTNSVTVSLSVTPATDIYYTIDGTTPSASSTRYTTPLTFTQTTTLKTYAANASGSDVKTFTYTKGNIDEPVDEDAYYIYFDDTSKTDVAVWAWTTGNVNCTDSGKWPGDRMTKKNGKYYWAVPAGKSTPKNIIISWGNHDDSEKAGGGDLEFVNKHIYKADGSHTLANFGPQKPVITVSPDGGNVRGAASITVQIDNNATSITGSFNNRTVTLGNGTTTLKVSDYLGENQSGTLSISATNSLGTATYSSTFKRDDSQPVVTLSGDWRELNIYQIMVASFQHGAGGASGYSDMWGPSGHRKNGNLRGIINALDYIKELGMNAIWMTPIFDSTNGQGGEQLQATGYFCTNYFKVDPKFGTEAEFDELIREAHSRGMYVILDGVFGHHGGVTSASPNGNRIQTQDNTPNVRGSESGNIVFPGSLEYFKEVIRYWMERGVDGWRLDQCYQAYQGGHNYWKELRQEAEKVAAERKARGEQWGTLAFMVGEDWANADKVTTTQQDGLKSVMDFDAMYTFEYMDNVSTAGYFLSRTPSDRGYSGSGVYPTVFLSNHDTDRIGDYADVNSEPQKLMARHAVVAASTGPTCTYYGDEIGDKSGKATHNGNADNWARTSGRLSGFNANEQKLHDYVAKIFKARAENPALWRGTAERKTQGQVEIITKTDAQSGNKVVVVFSPADTNVSIGGSGLDLINGGNVSGTVSVKAWVPAFIKMN
ncbi:MAG: chitobiase/beta-hexosaminidase C-terminal domain-containing protein [Muribaculaceae bacterium]|nr:chitobiase/beta-hexosaminidase C-terminal domain-containing protein [Muribaculaceae bacterium]